jgi:hypothetical protein
MNVEYSNEYFYPSIKIILTQISEQKILMWFLSHNIPKQNKLAEKNLTEKPRIHVKLLITM